MLILNINRKKAILGFFIICGIVVLVLSGIKKLTADGTDIKSPQINFSHIVPVNMIKVLAPEKELIDTEIKADSVTLGTSAQSTILIDANSKNIVYENNAYKRFPMASTTKIMCI